MPPTPTHEVLINREGQYSVWPAHRAAPAGWDQVGVRGTEDRCLEYITQAWADLRPRSARLVGGPPIETAVPSGEQALWLGSALADHPGTDVVTACLLAPRPLDAVSLNQAWADVARRHPHLRTRYHLRTVSGRERVVAGVDADPVALEWDDTARHHSLTPDQAREQLESRAWQLHRRPRRFDAPPGVAAGIELGPDATGLVLSFAHAILDGRSLAVVLSDLLLTYDALIANRSPDPVEAATAYQTFRTTFAARHAQLDPGYWRDYPIHPRHEPTLTPTTSGDVARPQILRGRLSAATTSRLRAAQDRHAMPLSTLVYSAWAATLAARGGSDRVTFATTLAHRHAVPGSERMVGPAVATVPLSVDTAQSPRALATGVRHDVLAHRQQSWASWPELLAWCTEGEQSEGTVESLVVIDRLSLEGRVHQTVPSWRDAEVWTLRHSSFAVTLHVYDHATPLCELTVDADVGHLGPALLAQLESALLSFCDRLLDDELAQAAHPLPAHRWPLAPRWSVWRDLVLRTAGLEFDLLDGLGDPLLAALADEVNADPAAPEPRARYDAEFGLAGRRLGHALHRLGADPRIREALAWQNPGALRNGVDPLLRRDPDVVSRATKHRQHEAMLASYVQRYSAKNDTIGFFGPVGWARFVDGSGITVRNAADGWIDRRSTYLEGWAVRALAARHEAALRPWLTPQLLPHVGYADGHVSVPLARPFAVGAAEAAVLDLVDGRRTAWQIAAAVDSIDATEVWTVLDRLAQARRISWRFRIPHHEPFPERLLRSQLDAIAVSSAAPGADADPDVARATREQCLADLDRLCAARRALADAAGDPVEVADAMSRLAETVEEVTGGSAARRAGQLYAGRTPAYEECRLGVDVEFGTELLGACADSLEVVLNAARWFAYACREAFADLFERLYRERSRQTGSTWVPLGDLWVVASEHLSDPETELLTEPLRELARRWQRVLDLPEGAAESADEIVIDPAAALARSRRLFSTGEADLGALPQHSPDLMYQPGRDGRPDRWVLGEVHPGQNTMAYRTWVKLHDAPQALRDAARADYRSAAVRLIPDDQLDGRPTRLTYALDGPDDLWIATAPGVETTGLPRVLRLGDAVVGPAPSGDHSGARQSLVIRHGDVEVPAGDALADVVSNSTIQHFGVGPRSTGRSPRLVLGDLVLARATWREPCAGLSWAQTKREDQRFLQVRAWAAGRGLGRYLFMRTTGEKKPVFLDLSSLVSIDLLCRAVRRSIRDAGETATLTLSEMLPGPDDLWFTGSDGRRRTAELRLVAVDDRAAASGREDHP